MKKIKALIRIDDIDIEIIDTADITIVSVDRPIMDVLCDNASANMATGAY